MIDPVIKFLPYQQAWIGDDSRYKIGMMTRRGGKTFGSCGEIVDDCINAELEREPTRWTILSRSENTAKEALEGAVTPMTRGFYEAYKMLRNAGSPDYSEDVFRAPGYERQVLSPDGKLITEWIPEAVHKVMEVKFPGGSRISALSASPGAARGFGGNILLDEFAFHRDPRLIWAAAIPVAARGNHKVRVISTPNGKGNKFHEVMTGDDPIWSRHITDIYEAVKQGLDVNADEVKAAINDQEIWDQEFRLLFLEAASSWLLYEQITACESDVAGHPAGYQGGPCYVGVDLGARRDLYVIWVCEDVDGKLVTREIVEMQKGSLTQKHKKLAEIMSKYRVARLAMDQTGMGEKPVEDAKNDFGESRVDGVIFSSPRRYNLALGFKEAFEDGKILIPANNSPLRADLHSIKSQIGPTGARRLVAAEADTDGHADRFWAGALATAAFGDPHQPYDYRRVTPANNNRERPIKITAGFGARKGLF